MYREIVLPVTRGTVSCLQVRQERTQKLAAHLNQLINEKPSNFRLE